MLAHVYMYLFTAAGVLLKPLCFVLEWASGGSLHSVLQKYRKADARISPMVLQETAKQVTAVTM